MSQAQRNTRRDLRRHPRRDFSQGITVSRRPSAVAPAPVTPIPVQQVAPKTRAKRAGDFAVEFAVDVAKTAVGVAVALAATYFLLIL